MARAVETAQPIAEVLGLPVALDKRLRERALGTAEGTPAALLPAAQSGVEAGRVVDADAAPPGGESVRQLYDRATAFLAELFAHVAGGDVVLVSHGGVVRVLEAWLDGTGPDEMAWPEVGHAHPVVRHVPAPGGSGVRRKEARCT